MKLVQNVSVKRPWKWAWSAPVLIGLLVVAMYVDYRFSVSWLDRFELLLLWCWCMPCFGDSKTHHLRWDDWTSPPKAKTPVAKVKKLSISDILCPCIWNVFKIAHSGYIDTIKANGDNPSAKVVTSKKYFKGFGSGSVNLMNFQSLRFT